MSFAKLFDSPEFGQILVTRDVAEQGPAVIFHVEPPGLGVCQTLANFEDTDAGWDARDKAFEAVTLEQAEAFAGSIFAAARQLPAFADEPNPHNPE